jgi:hypothetical protein
MGGTHRRPGQFKELLRHGFHGLLNFWEEWRTKAKLLAFNTVDQQGSWKTVHGARQFYRFAQAESMRGTVKDIVSQPAAVDIPHPNFAGRSAGRGRVH